MVRRGRKRKQLIHDLEERRGYGKLKEKTLTALYGELAVEVVIDLSLHRL
jgi:hypothetical protein